MAQQFRLVNYYNLPRHDEWNMALSENVGYIPNEIAIFKNGIMIIKHWVQRGTLFSDPPTWINNLDTFLKKNNTCGFTWIHLELVF